MDLDYIELRKLESEWRDSQKRHTTKELLEIFPEVKDVVPEKVKELSEDIEIIDSLVKKLYQIINDHELNDFDDFFYRKYVEIFYQKELERLLKERKRFERLLYNQDLVPINEITNDDIERAKQEPIENFLPDRLQKFGNKYRCHCPLHTENTPSCYVYKNNNSFYCFGCKKGGDVITLIRYLNDCSFIDAIKYILRK